MGRAPKGVTTVTDECSVGTVTAKAFGASRVTESKEAWTKEVHIAWYDLECLVRS